MSDLRQRKSAAKDVGDTAGTLSSTHQQRENDEAKQEVSFLSQDCRCLIQPLLAFFGLVTIRFLSVDLAIISDCDEVFNYWEPTHYLAHGYGLQTWEYSPVYAIRSWSYIGLHALFSRSVVKILGGSKVQEFFYLRAVFAMFCSLCETRLYQILSTSLGYEVGAAFLFVSATSAGMFGAGVAYLPSTFAMYFAALGMASFLQVPRRPGIGVFCFAIGGVLGWPFALALAVPLVLDSAVRGAPGSTFASRITPVVGGAVASALLLAAVVCVDSYAYGKLAVVPLNIVLYNVFGGSGKGPDLYGTEPWWFYIANLALNFNVFAFLALIAAPLLLVSHKAGFIKLNNFSAVAGTSVFYVWLFIFSAQPHKEERFMFPVYPALCVNAAISLALIYRNIAAIQARPSCSDTVRAALDAGRGLLFLGVAASAALSVSRLVALSGYSAPLRILNPPPQGGAAPATGAPPANITVSLSGNLCYGKEWYRYPSTYFLPADARMKFVKSRFDGLLPGEFKEPTINENPWDRPGIWTIPEGMNDENKEDMKKYVDIRECDYIVDSYFEGDEGRDELEPAFIKKSNEWSKLYCEQFLDAGRTPWIGRAFYIPKIKDRRVWGEYCLLGRKHSL